MGYRHGTACFSDAAGAAAAECASLGGVTSGGYLRCKGVGAGIQMPTLLLETTAPGGGTTSTTVPTSYAQCDPLEPYTDVTEVFGYSVLAVLGVVLIREFIYRHVMPQ